LGKYRVLEPLGRGGMARVYRAYHPQLDRYVAIKVLRPDLVDEAEFMARFRREAQAVAALRHANIVQVFDFDVENDVTYMVMELLEGDTLKTRMSDYRARDEQMPLGETVRIVLDVLDGLDYAHSEGMIHRDIKPANIMLTRRGEAVVTDFGIARIIGGTRHTADGALMGTLNYIAPEQGLQGQSDARSDLYSLGIVLYEMLTRRTPFDADTPLAILMKHLNDPLPLPRQVNPAIPEPLERVVLKVLSKRPEDRYQSAAEMAQALRQAAAAAEVELPGRISLPLSFATAEAPSESVAVISGTARERIADAEFAKDDTDITLGDRGRAERTEVESELPDEGAASPASRPLGSILRVALGTLGLLAACNLVAVFGAGVIGRWGIFERGWPIELLVLALGFSIALTIERIPWLLAPAGILLGHGMIFAYSSITGNWHHWDFLWALEPPLVIGAIWAAIWFTRHRDRTERFLPIIGGVLILTSVVWSVAVAWLALLLP
jgi:serine/threonine-protein kinase